MKRNDGENFLQYAERVTQALIDGSIGCSEWCEDILGDKIYSEENLRRCAVFFEQFMKRLDDEEVKALNDNSRVEEIQKAKEELIKERYRLQDVARQQRNDRREEARFENLCEVLKENIKSLPLLNCERGWTMPEDNEKKYAVLCLSDWHCGMIVDNQFNYYDVQTMKDRASVVVEKAISYCCEHNVSDLVVEVNADMIDGDIHISSRVQQEQDVVQQVVTVSETLAECIDKLAPWFNTVKVYCTLGNHGRLMSNKKDCITKENFELLIPEFLKLRLQAHDNVTVVDSKGMDFLKYEVDGKVICMAHGQNDSLPRAVEDFSKIYKQVPDEVHLAHYHSYRDVSDCDVMVNINGSLCGADDYALSIRKINAPAQNLIIYDHDRCIYSLKAEELN